MCSATDQKISRTLNTVFFLLQGSSKPRPRFELDGGNNGSASGNSAAANAAVSALSNQDDKDLEGGKRRPSYMPTRGLAAVLNQGLATLGEKLGNLSFPCNSV